MIKQTIFPCLAVGLIAGAVSAQDLSSVASVTVLPGWDQADGSRMAGLRITLAPGWKTYWRAPGDAGIPPLVSFAGSENIAGTQMAWPVPEVFDQNGMRSIGYAESVVVPLMLSPDEADGPLHLRGQMQIGVCEEVCIPVTLDFDALLPPQGSRDAAIVAAMVNRPLTASEAGLTASTCSIAPQEDGITLTAQLILPDTGGNETVVIEAGNPQIWVSEADTLRQGDTLTATVDMVHTSYAAFAIDRSSVRITVLGADHAVDIRGCDPG